MTPGPDSIRILVADDHPLVRTGLGAVLASEPDMCLVAEASDGCQALHEFRSCRPDVTLMDLHMPEMNGLDATVAILGEFPDARVIMLATDTGDVQVLRAMKAGSGGPC